MRARRRYWFHSLQRPFFLFGQPAGGRLRPGSVVSGRMKRNSIEPEVCMGQYTIRGMRITVAFVLSLLASGMDTRAVLKAYPELEEEDIRQSLAYAAWLAAEQTQPLPQEAAGP